MTTVLEKLVNHNQLTSQEIDHVFEDMVHQRMPAVQAAAYLTAWRTFGEDALLLERGALFLRRNANKVNIDMQNRPFLDNCGTGGDGSMSFNISTAAAIVTAASGVPVAKHGNRSVSSRCGSADLLFACGYPESLPVAATAELLSKHGFTFFFAPNFHPILKSVGALRKELGIRTVFNLLGPLANPIAPPFQVIGVGARKYLESVANAAKALGMTKALVVHSRDGMDEISPTQPTDAVLLEHAKLTQLVIDPKAVGLPKLSGALTGGGVEENKAILTSVLNGEQSIAFHTVALNAGANIYLYGSAPDVKVGYEKAQEILSTGRAKVFFERWLASAKTLAFN